MKKTLIVAVLLGVIMSSCALIQTKVQPNKKTLSAIQSSEQFKEGKFHNAKAMEPMSLAKFPGYIKRYMTEDRVDIEPVKPVPVLPVTAQTLAQLPSDSITLFRLGHSSFLLKAAGEYWLIDPVFSDRDSPFSFMGPKRYHLPPITIDALPNIKGVIISHNHYDHLDKEAVKQLAAKVENFIVPLGIGHDLQNWGVPQDNITELDWWQSTEVGGLSLTATPAQHFSGRGLTDGNKKFWSSWVMKTDTQSLFYSGDSGYFDGF
ncbi:MAG: MBL fold metallo-hydrolase, partial [Psychrosphaera sp.]|nr:MBL fold metallo-hydrolase [Psychrosphaera sp.]